MFVLDVDVVGGEDGVGFVSCVLRSCAFSVSCIPGSCGVVDVVSGVRRRSITPWVCCLLGSPYVPCRGAWVLRL